MSATTNRGRRLRRLLLPVLAGLALLASACSVSLGDGAPAAGGADAAALQEVAGGDRADAIVAAIQQVAPAVVTVRSYSAPTGSPFGITSEGGGLGTGFVVRSDGVVVTNEHVIQGAQRVTVTLPDEDRTVDAEVVATDAEHDLAVLRADATGLPAVPLGSSADLLLGQQVVALGYALGLEGGPTVTSGIVSSLDRTIQVQDPNSPDGARTYTDVLQTDAAINPGNSGGPLIDLAGRVVGIDSAGSSQAENIGFAIAIDAAKPLIERALGATS
jgi:S1-C subfamily serine protease